MIEFKADCGHTVRARDEDAGSVVRCSYCGRNAEVPEQDGGDLDFLFRDVTQPEEKKSRRRRRKRKPTRAPSSKPTTLDPFSLTLKMFYAAALIVVLIVITRWWVLPLFEDGIAYIKKQSNMAGATPVEREPNQQRPQRSPPGLIGRDARVGLYVASTPPGATVYCVPTSKLLRSGRVGRSGPGVKQFEANGRAERLTDGEYVVEVVFRLNHPRLSSQKLSDYAGYLDFRRQVEESPAERRRELMAEYFLPDGAADMRVDKTPEQIYFLVRQYQGVDIHKGRSSGVRALFLPRLEKEVGAGFSLEPLLHGYIPTKQQYVFSESHVRGELAYHQVAQRDVRFVIDALSRIGIVPYVAPNGDVRLFRIDIHDGTFSAPIIEYSDE